MWIIKKTCYVIFCKHHHTNIATEIKPTKTKPSTRCFFGFSRKQRGLLDARVESPHSCSIWGYSCISQGAILSTGRFSWYYPLVIWVVCLGTPSFTENIIYCRHIEMIGSGDKGRIFRPVSLDSQKLQEAKCQVANFTIMSLFFSVWVMRSIQH